MINFEGHVHFNLVTLEPLRIQDWYGVDAKKAIRMKVRDRSKFGIMDFKNNPGSSFEGTMSIEHPFSRA
jgi:hypothetical protein